MSDAMYKMQMCKVESVRYVLDYLDDANFEYKTISVWFLGADIFAKQNGILD